MKQIGKTIGLFGVLSLLAAGWLVGESWTTNWMDRALAVGEGIGPTNRMEIARSSVRATNYTHLCTVITNYVTITNCVTVTSEVTTSFWIVP